MKEILLKIWKGILYFFWGIFILMSITTLFDWWSLIVWLFTIIFSVLMLPIVYSKIKEVIYKIKPKLSNIKFVLLYIAIIFFWYITSFSILISDIAGEQAKEKAQIEDITLNNISKIKTETTKNTQTEIEYEVIWKYQHISKKFYFWDIIIKNINENTDLDFLKSEMKRISKEINIEWMSINLNKEAIKWNGSSSYLLNNPDVLKDWYLGDFKDNELNIYSEFKWFNKK